MRNIVFYIGFILSVILIGYSPVFANFSTTLDGLQQEYCVGVIDGTVVVEDPDNGTYRYAMCYAGEVLTELDGTVWYVAGEDLLKCIENADYDFNGNYNNMAKLVPACENYGQVLYEYFIDTDTLVATTQSFNGNIDIENINEDNIVGSGLETQTVSVNSWGVYIIILGVLLVMFGIYALFRKRY